MIETLTPDYDTAPETFVLPASLLHDLRTPLNQIIGYSELLLEQAKDDGQNAIVPDISKVRSAGGELLTLINSKFSATTLAQPMQPTTTDPSEKTTNSWPDITLPGNSLTGLGLGKVLVVDDGASNRDILSRRLTSQGYSVIMAENGRQAMEMVRSNEFDLILLDIMMPEIDGFEVLRRLKSDDLLKHIPVIMISALSETVRFLMRCIDEMGAEDYFA